MNLFQLRLMIKESIHRHTSQEKRKMHSVPRDFMSFRRMLSTAVTESSRSQTLGDMFNSHESNVFTPIWDTWTYFEAELKECKDEKEMKKVWNEVVDFYTHDVLTSVLMNCGITKSSNNVRALSESVSRCLKEKIEA